MPFRSVSKPLGRWGRELAGPEMETTGSLPRRCVVLDLALVALTIVVFVVLALVLKGLERL
jgi:hypothetical protein